MLSLQFLKIISTTNKYCYMIYIIVAFLKAAHKNSLFKNG